MRVAVIVLVSLLFPASAFRSPVVRGSNGRRRVIQMVDQNVLVGGAVALSGFASGIALAYFAETQIVRAEGRGSDVISTSTKAKMSAMFMVRCFVRDILSDRGAAFRRKTRSCQRVVWTKPFVEWKRLWPKPRARKSTLARKKKPLLLSPRTMVAGRREIYSGYYLLLSKGSSFLFTDPRDAVQRRLCWLFL